MTPYFDLKLISRPPFSCVRAYTETDSDCPVCQSKNAGILDALREQQETRKLHDQFHDQLNRIVEPFSLLAKYFGHGLFNRIVIFDENDLKRTPERKQQLTGGDVLKKPTTKPVTGPAGAQALAFGSGAEAKMRVTENKSNVIPAPQSEARMRLQEQQRKAARAQSSNTYSSSLEANIDWSVAKSRAAAAGGQKQKPAAAVSKQPAEPYPKSANPFGDDEEEKGGATAAPPIGTNPFGDEEEEEEVKPQIKVAKVASKADYNPFDEDESNNNYDKSLNPFDD